MKNCHQPTPRVPFVEALLQEITALLDELLRTGKEGAIDLRGLPLLESDRKQLEQALGHGEVNVLVSALGETRVWETAFAGVWWLRHMQVQGEGRPDKIISEQIAVTFIPEILKTHRADAESALQNLQQKVGREGERAGEALS